MLEFTIDGIDYNLINIFNVNAATGQIYVHLNSHLLLDGLDIYQNKQIILAEEFNLFLDTILESKWSSPCLKKKSVAKLIKIK